MELLKKLQVQGANSPDMASRYRVMQTRLRKFEEIGAPEASPIEQDVKIGLKGGRTGLGVVTCEQRARFQILWLEIGGSTILLLDEPTDNLDLASAEVLEQGSNSFQGTVLAVTHHRWFKRGFDRYLIFPTSGQVYEAQEPVWEY